MLNAYTKLELKFGKREKQCVAVYLDTSYLSCKLSSKLPFKVKLYGKVTYVYSNIFIYSRED